MTDGIIKGTGNSRYLKTVPNALTLYPDWPTALQAMVDGTFPVDFNGINPNGWTTQGTKLSKANLLTDAVANALSLTGEKTPTQAFEKLRQLVSTVQSTADSKLSIQTITYTGSGTETGNYKRISFGSRSSLFMMVIMPTTLNRTSQTAITIIPLYDVPTTFNTYFVSSNGLSGNTPTACGLADVQFDKNYGYLNIKDITYRFSSHNLFDQPGAEYIVFIICYD